MGGFCGCWGGGEIGKKFPHKWKSRKKVMSEEMLFHATVKSIFGATTIPQGKAQKRDKFSVIL